MSLADPPPALAEKLEHLKQLDAARGAPADDVAAAPDDADPDAFDARPVPNEPQREPEDRLADAMAPPIFVGADGSVRPHDDYDEGNAEVAFEGWTIEDLDGATWAARKLHRLQVRREQFRRMRDDHKARLDAWFADETKRIDADARFFGGRLEGFHRHALNVDPKNAKTIRLPDGSELASQAGKLAVEVTDANALLTWAEMHELAAELFRYPDPEPQKQTLAKRFDGKAAQETEPGNYAAVDGETGEVIPGVEIVRRPRTFTFRGPADEPQP